MAGHHCMVVEPKSISECMFLYCLLEYLYYYCMHQLKSLSTTMRHIIFPCALWSSSLTLLLLFRSWRVSTATPTAHFAMDRLALLSFKSLVHHDPFGALASWNDNNSLHFCQWRGVTCRNCSRQLRVTALELQSLGLAGKISPSLANLTFLQRLHLPENQLQGPIPQELGFLSHLQHLNLSYNPLGGMIPMSLFHNCSHLRNLSLNGNNLHGPIPRNLGRRCLELQIISLTNNMLEGEIPSECGFLSKLQVLALWDNRLVGNIPAAIGNLTSLRVLDLHNNQITAAIPAAIGNLSSLIKLDLSSNQLTGAIPSEIVNLKHLTQMYLFDNQLTGVIPVAIGNLSSLILLRLSSNQLTGAIPSEMENLVNLNLFCFASNLLSGTIPATLGGLQNLEQISLGENHFVGEIPTNLGNLTRLSILDLFSNQLQGPIPPSIAKCSLELLDLSLNKLNGTVPKEILSIPTLTRLLDLSNNSLSGSLPSEVGNLKNIGSFRVSNNRLSGVIPSTIGGCEVLQNLYMDGNLFHGSIPSSFSQLKGVEELDLSRNNLSGNIPRFLGSFPFLKVINLSFNNFEGQVPTDGIFTNTSGFSVVGNDKLCGGVHRLNLPPCSKRSHLSRKLITIISAAAGTMCLILLLLSLYATLCWICKVEKEAQSMALVEGQHKKVSYAELLQATNDFSAANLIGVGSFGSVYKGFMHYDDECNVVAVKVFNLGQRGSSRSFISECEALRNIRHRNLVKILTACASIDFRGNDFKALVYQFLPNGNLDEWLHAKADEQSRGTLSLIQRLSILMDVASALDYLHHHGPEPIVHCDIKPSNILLDNDMVAHVGDFGLARLLNRVPIGEDQKSSSSMILKGTIGYVAPEYGVANQASLEGDLYSYGILVLEMFTGKRPTDEAFNDGLSLPQYVAMALRSDEDVAEAMDVNLDSIEQQGGEEANGGTEDIRAGAVECIMSILRIGIKCTKELPTERMQMRDVISELIAIRSTLFEQSVRGERRRVGT